jgi:hypothetical protein
MMKRSRWFSIQHSGYSRHGNTYQKILLQLIVDCGGDKTNVEERQGHHGSAVLATPLPE